MSALELARAQAELDRAEAEVDKAIRDADAAVLERTRAVKARATARAALDAAASRMHALRHYNVDALDTAVAALRGHVDLYHVARGAGNEVQCVAELQCVGAAAQQVMAMAARLIHTSTTHQEPA
jgi:hypothetical protein